MTKRISRAEKDMAKAIQHLQRACIYMASSISEFTPGAENNTYEYNHTVMEFLMRIEDVRSELKKGICRQCGCTWHNACSHPDAGNCSWTDDTHTLCSHCSDEKLRTDPLTIHRVAGKIYIA